MDKKKKQQKGTKDNGLYTLLCGGIEENDLVEVKAPINGLILSPKASLERCKKVYKEWMKETFNEDV